MLFMTFTYTKNPKTIILECIDCITPTLLTCCIIIIWNAEKNSWEILFFVKLAKNHFLLFVNSHDYKQL